MDKLIGLTLLVATVSALTTANDTTTTGGRIWKCESEISKYNNSYCNQPGNSTGCYCPELFGTCKSCGSLCNDVQEYSSDEKSCNHSCPDYLSQECTLVYDVRTTTTTHGSRSSSSCVVTGVVTTLVCLVIGAALGVGGTCFHFKRKEERPRRPTPTDPDNHSDNEDDEADTPLNNIGNPDNGEDVNP